MILSYFVTLILSSFSITFFKHANAAILLCSLLSLTTTWNLFQVIHIMSRLGITCCENNKGTVSKVSTLNHILLYIFVWICVIHMHENLSMVWAYFNLIVCTDIYFYRAITGFLNLLAASWQVSQRQNVCRIFLL